MNPEGPAEAGMDSSPGAVSQYGTKSPFRQAWQCLLHTATLKTWFSSLDTSYHLEQRLLPAPGRVDWTLLWRSQLLNQLYNLQKSGGTWIKLWVPTTGRGACTGFGYNSVVALQLGMLRRCCSILPCNNMKQKLSRKSVNQIRLIKQFLSNGVAHKNFIKTSSAKFISWVCHRYFFFQ